MGFLDPFLGLEKFGIILEGKVDGVDEGVDGSLSWRLSLARGGEGEGGAQGDQTNPPTVERGRDQHSVRVGREAGWLGRNIVNNYRKY